MLPLEELKTTIFHNMMQRLSKEKEELTEFEIKSIIFESINSFSAFEVKWGKPVKFGKNRILIHYQNRIAILDLNLLIHFIKDVWKNYLNKNQ